VNYEVRVGGQTFDITVDGDRVQINGRPVRAVLLGVPHSPLRRLVLDGASQTVALVRSGDHWTVHGGGSVWDVEVLDERSRNLRRVVGQAGGERKGGGAIRAPMPGMVLRVQVSEGQEVASGTGLVVLEAMKMENEIKATGAGVVQRILVKPGAAVEKGAVLLELA
jgi:biotin carboxyl carrier protein